MFEYCKADMKIDSDQIMFLDSSGNLLSCYSIWKFMEVTASDSLHLAVHLDNGKKFIINFLKSKTQNCLHESFSEMIRKKKRYFSTIPFTIIDARSIGSSMSHLTSQYTDYRYLLPRPLIWGKTIPPFTRSWVYTASKLSLRKTRRSNPPLRSSDAAV